MNDLRSLIPPSISHSSQKALKPGDTVPDAPKLGSDKPSIVAFLRHIGCPFAEKTFRDLHAFAEIHRDQYQYIAISHGTERDTKDWIEEVGGMGRITVLSDEQFQMYQAWVI
jgi:peroxiredoxin